MRNMERPLRLSVLAAGLAFGAVSLAIARNEPGYSFGGDSAGAGAAELLTGYGLLAIGLVALARRNREDSERSWSLPRSPGSCSSGTTPGWALPSSSRRG